MVMPASNQAWPPISQNRLTNLYQRMDAWYSGDEEALSWLYATNQLQTHTSLWGQVKRFFWGTPIPQQQSQRPVKIHVPLPAEIARMSAQQLFSEMPTTHLGDMDNDSDDRGITNAAQGKTLSRELDDILDDNAHAELLQAAELAAVFGGAYLRIQWDTTVCDHPFITAMAPDHALPTFGLGGRLQSVIYWMQLPPIDGVKLNYKLLEEETPGRIEYALYESQDDRSLGIRVPLDTHPMTRGISVDEQSGIDTGSSLLASVYVPNLKPNHMMRTDPAAYHLGRSDFMGAESLFDSIDESYTSWMRDIRLGKARVFVSRDMLTMGKPGEGSTMNMDQEIFTPLNQAPGSTLNQGKLFETFQPAIRWQEHQNTCRELVERAYAACGYSASTFGSAGDVAMTATEAQAREKLTMLTRSAKILYWRPQLRALYAALLDVNHTVFHGPDRMQALPDVEFPDAASDAPNIVAQTLNLLNQAESASIQTRVGMLHPDWTDEQVTEEVMQIKQDDSMLPDPSEKNLWAAVASNGSSTGGVPANSYGSLASNNPATAKTAEADYRKAAHESDGDAINQPAAQ